MLAVILEKWVKKYAEQPEYIGDKKRLTLDKSFAAFEEAKKTMPGGITGMRSPNAFIPGEYPIYMEKAQGSHMWDLDGNEYIDFMAAYGPVMIGYNEPEINEKVFKRIKDGFCFSLPQEVQNELARKIVELVPAAEQVIFARTGTDATTIAVKLVRSYTKKQRILTDGYHGWGDFSMYDGDSGVLPQALEMTTRIPYGDYETYEQEVKKGNVAAIMVTPVRHEKTSAVILDKLFLKKLRQLADDYQIPLIFDEVRTGFRITIAGVQPETGVLPDVVTFAKAIANGYTLSAVVGKKEILGQVSKKVPEGTFVSSTYFLNSLELAASLETLNFYQKYHVQEEVRKKGQYFLERLNQLIATYDLPFLGTGLPAMPSINFDKNVLGEEMYAKAQLTFYSYLIRSGIFMSPYHHVYIMYRHSQQDLDQALTAIEGAMKVVKDLL